MNWNKGEIKILKLILDYKNILDNKQKILNELKIFSNNNIYTLSKDEMITENYWNDREENNPNDRNIDLYNNGNLTNIHSNNELFYIENNNNNTSTTICEGVNNITDIKQIFILNY
jgi:hypothetical protein|tara:strand:+ start:763 stop:1110 length:348 start_codon:yes stop_codon:yes gene_type:complete